MATHSSILAWRIPWTEEAGALQSIGPQRVVHDQSDLARMHSGLNRRNVFSQSSGSWNFKIKPSVGLILSKGWEGSVCPRPLSLVWRQLSSPCLYILFPDLIKIPVILTSLPLKILSPSIITFWGPGMWVGNISTSTSYVLFFEYLEIWYKVLTIKFYI